MCFTYSFPPNSRRGLGYLIGLPRVRYRHLLRVFLLRIFDTCGVVRKRSYAAVWYAVVRHSMIADVVRNLTRSLICRVRTKCIELRPQAAG